MSDIAELEGRIAAAIERIGRAVESFDADAGSGSGVSAAELDAARAEAETARVAAQQAEERVGIAVAEAARLTQALEAETTASTQLRERVASLKSMKESQQERILELEAMLERLSAQRAEDREELDGLIAALEPLVQEQADA